MCAASEALASRVGENNNRSLVGPMIGDGEAPRFVPGATSGNDGSRTKHLQPGATQVNTTFQTKESSTMASKKDQRWLVRAPRDDSESKPQFQWPGFLRLRRIISDNYKETVSIEWAGPRSPIQP